MLGAGGVFVGYLGTSSITTDLRNLVLVRYVKRCCLFLLGDSLTGHDDYVDPLGPCPHAQKATHQGT